MQPFEPLVAWLAVSRQLGEDEEVTFVSSKHVPQHTVVARRHLGIRTVTHSTLRGIHYLVEHTKV